MLNWQIWNLYPFEHFFVVFSMKWYAIDMNAQYWYWYIPYCTLRKKCALHWSVQQWQKGKWHKFEWNTQNWEERTVSEWVGNMKQKASSHSRYKCDPFILRVSLFHSIHNFSTMFYPSSSSLILLEMKYDCNLMGISRRTTVSGQPATSQQ